MIQHVTLRTNRGMPLFEADAERRLFLDLARTAAVDFDWVCLSYCLMVNHVHLLIRPERPTLSAGMQWLTTRYARYYNDRRQRYGHVFQGRFGSQAVERQRYLREVMRYIALNPVRAGLCRDPAVYRWSAHRALVGVGSGGPVADEEALAAFGSNLKNARATYANFVADREGAARFATSPGEHLPAAEPSLEELVCNRDGDRQIVVAHLDHGHSFAAIARVLGCSRWTVARRFARVRPARAPLGD